jgi:hypothetical protein
VPSASPAYRGHRYPVEIISYRVWLYFRFPLSFREVGELMRRGLQPIRPGDEATIELRLPTDHRVDPVADRTRTTNRLRALLNSMLPALKRALDLGKASPLVLLAGYQSRASTRRSTRRCARRTPTAGEGSAHRSPLRGKRRTTRVRSGGAAPSGFPVGARQPEHAVWITLTDGSSPTASAIPSWWEGRRRRTEPEGRSMPVLRPRCGRGNRPLSR